MTNVAALPKGSLSSDELIYHESLVAQMQKAQQAIAFAQETRAAWDSWSRHISSKYTLGDGDSVTEDGTIVRAK